MLELLFVFLAVFCALSSYAIRECSESKVKKAAEDGDKKAAKLLPLVQEPDDFCAAMHVGAVGFGFFAVFNPLTNGLARHLGELLPQGAPRNLEQAILWVALLLLGIALCDFAPERYAWYRPEKAARGVLPLARLLEKLLRPVTKLLLGLSSLALRLFGVNTKAELEDVSEDEIRLMVDAGEESGAIQSEEKEMIENIFAFDDLTVEEIMVHRTDMTVLWLDDSSEEIVRTIRESGLSRFPVCGEDVDDILGILSTRDYLLARSAGGDVQIRGILRPAHFVPESAKADVLFRELQQKKVHMAIVVDEYGGTSGLVTMEDLLEQLVGEIYDEFDAEEEKEITPLPDGSWRIAGQTPLKDVAEALDMDFPEEDVDEYETLGGLVFGQLAVIPADGSRPRVQTLGLDIQAEPIAEHRVEWAQVRKLPQETPPNKGDKE